jgi:polysaccharide chain length determinant protein (PEP-CTERM system associated)
MHALVVKILDDLRGTWRFRWWALVAAWGICCAGWLFVISLPDVYEASARVYVDSQTALRPLLKGLAVEPNVESELSIVRQALLSRPQLESVARTTDLDLRATTPQRMDELLNSLRQRISVTTDARSASSTTDGLYRITFQDQSREKALHVVETLLNTFVEDTLGSKRTGQESAQRFLDEQISDYENRLSEAESSLAEFKKRNVGTMPGEDGDYFKRLQAEMSGAGEVRKTLALAEARRSELNRQLGGEEPFVFGFDANANAGAQAQDGAGDVTYRIQELESRLEELLLRYTEKHPEVVAVRNTIEQLKAQQQEELSRLSRGERATGSMASSLKSNPIYQGIQAELKRTEVQIAELRQDLAQREARVVELKRLVNTVPEVEAELARLNRDYEVTRARYLDLVQRRETARISEDADKQGVVRFQRIDPPTVSFEPVAPKRKLLLVIVLLAGIGAAAALAYLMNQLRPVYQNARVLAQTTGLTVLGTVSRTWVARHRQEERRNLMAFSGAAALLLIVCVAILIWHDAGVRLAQRLLT